ncbi:WG repeat-containing protein [Phaeocystidibacter luteus]|uniref:WG repeat-containing protein n=1 Tax=Phaeocystidibacter luteus TaxID=911197 RepID=A0A6N6RH52_9FLAO|nr:WG repeat-containing protein [Phaeocystidibacter luteus]KAB2808592.1 WG repeat-containing protein [Phaeocystidibacter luteus]
MIRALLTILLFLSCLLAEAQMLFPFAQDGKWGYKDIDGSWVIQPRFDAAQLFSEGKAAVRESGYYHFIDSSGHRLTWQNFEKVENFEHGLSCVYVDGSWALIDDQFQILNDGFNNLYVANSNLVIGRKDSTQVILNRFGRVVIEELPVNRVAGDKVILSLGPNSEYRFGVAKPDGSIDTIPVKHCLINRIDNQLFATTTSNSSAFDQLWSLQGELMYTLPEEYSVHWSSYSFPLILRKGGNKEFDYQILNRSGELTKAPDFDNFHAVSDNRFIGFTRDKGWLLLNTIFDTLSDDFLRPGGTERFYDYSFLDGKAMVQYHGEWCLIDTNFNILQRLDLPTGFDGRVSLLTPSFAIVQEREFFYTLLDLNTGELYRDYTQIKFLDHQSVSVVLRDGERVTYITPDDVAVHHTGGQVPMAININYKIGNGVSRPAIEFDDQDIPEKEGFYIEIDTTQMVLNRDSFFRGPTVRIVNNTSSPILYDSHDGNMILYIEALDIRDGVWKPISFNGGHGCVVQGFKVESIKANSVAYRTIPMFEGGMQTKMRVRFERVFQEGVEKPSYPTEERVENVNGEVRIITVVYISTEESWPLGSPNYREVISNEIPISINPAQFWNTDSRVNW